MSKVWKNHYCSCCYSLCKQQVWCIFNLGLVRNFQFYYWKYFHYSMNGCHISRSWTVRNIYHQIQWMYLLVDFIYVQIEKLNVVMLKVRYIFMRKCNLVNIFLYLCSCWTLRIRFRVKKKCFNVWPAPSEINDIFRLAEIT